MLGHDRGGVDNSVEIKSADARTISGLAERGIARPLKRRLYFGWAHTDVVGD